MARKLKTYQTSQGFFDLVIAAPSMKAALETWGANSNLFHEGFAKEVGDPKTVKAPLAKPGILLKRPVGSSEPFCKQAHLPTSAQLSGPLPPAQKRAKNAGQSTLTARR
jgi:colicin import membrane protein